MARRLQAAGFSTLGQVAALDQREAMRRFGEEGPALAARARGEDTRRVNPDRETKSISAETTFETDIASREALEAPLWRLCEKLARRLKEKEFAAAGVTLKLKTASFATRTRAARLSQPTRLPDVLFATVRQLLAK